MNMTHTGQNRTGPPAPPVALAIAGSDSGGGAGIQQDIRVFTCLGVFGASVITAITAQNSLGVHEARAVEPGLVARQLQVVMDDISPGFIKCGMLANSAVVKAISSVLSGFPQRHLVLDTVILSKNGATLLDPGGIEALKENLFPMATLITPNVPEAALLAGTSIDNERDAVRTATILREKAGNKTAILLKGGHLKGAEAVDILVDSSGVSYFRHPRIDTRHTHGTGCTLSSAITALLARGHALKEACRTGIQLTQHAIENAFPLGSGTGPLNPFCWNGHALPGAGAAIIG